MVTQTARRTNIEQKQARFQHYQAFTSPGAALIINLPSAAASSLRPHLTGILLPEKTPFALIDNWSNHEYYACLCRA
ncbi:protein of unknown function [Serratia sp. Tan611]|nr:protein of unknown function [Serratia sp. Tan611]